MRIVVCVKQVPDVQAERGFVSGRVDRDIEPVLNELDENAIEAALVLAEDHDATVTAVSMGPPAAEAALRRALQMGVETATLVTDPLLAGSDAPTTARVLAQAIRQLAEDEPVDLVITGMAALDGLTSLVPAGVAADLGWPALTLASEIAIEGDRVRVQRVLEDASEELTGPMPAVVSVTDAANEPRYPGFKGIMAAKKKSVAHLSLADLGLADVPGPGVATVVESAEAVPAREGGTKVVDDGQAGRVLAAYLLDNNLI